MNMNAFKDLFIPPKSKKDRMEKNISSTINCIYTYDIKENKVMHSLSAFGGQFGYNLLASTGLNNNDLEETLNTLIDQKKIKVDKIKKMTLNEPIFEQYFTINKESI